MTALSQVDRPPLGAPAVAPLIRASGLSRLFPLGERQFTALSDLSISIDAGESVAIVGRSGSGKSTLLNLITGIDRPTRGTIQVGGAALQELSENELTESRGRSVGIVFQFFQLLPTLSVLDNVLLAMDFVDVVPVRRRSEQAMHLLERVGLERHATKLPSGLSGGELQRAAVARALANDPPILVADEPTGNLDSKTGEIIVDLLLEMVAGGRTLIVVTHDVTISARLGRVVTLADGAIVSDTARPSR